MGKRKAVVVSILIMLPIGGILVFLSETAIRTALWFIVALAAYGFVKLWETIIRWLQMPDVEFKTRRQQNRHEANY